jgi:hypothetical protein
LKWGQLDKAIVDCDTAIGLKPNYAELALYGGGLARQQSGIAGANTDFDAAKALYLSGRPGWPGPSVTVSVRQIAEPTNRLARARQRNGTSIYRRAFH